MNHIAVQNVVALAKVSNTEPLNLRLLGAKIEGSRYNPRRFAALIIRKTKPRGTCMIFKSGKIVIIGCESENESELLAHKITKDINRCLNIRLSVDSYRITNIVASGHLPAGLDLGRIADDCLGVKDDNFPGLVYKMGHPIKTALIFSSGRVLLCGGLNRETLEEAYLKIRSNLSGYMVKSEEAMSTASN